jgi:DNA-binding GntR family transcriptional regulator
VPLSSRQHHDIVEKIAARQAAAAGRALYEHVIGSRERMHRAAARSRSSKPVAKKAR